MEKKRDERFSEIKKILDQGYKERLRKILEEVHYVDIGEFLRDEPEYAKSLLTFIESSKAASVLSEMGAEEAGAYLQTLPRERREKILSKMPVDDAADLLGELEEEDREELLPFFDSEDAEDLRELLEYDEDTAGGLMTTEYVAIPEDITTDRAIRVLRDLSPDAETIYYVYVIDETGKLKGVISLRELIIESPDTVISDMMHKHVISVKAEDDQEDVARAVSRYDLLAVPVVDDNGVLLGIITVDDVIDVINEEATEDMYRMAGTYSEAAEEDEDRIPVILKSRLPWLLVTVLGGLLSGTVLQGFSDSLSEMVALSFFIPMLIGIGGNVGTQSSTVTVRGIATGDINTRTVVSTIARESSVGVIMGAVMGLVVAFLAVFWQHDMLLGAVVGLSMMANIFTAATMGTLVPLFFKKVGVDPAVASAPFITTTIDIVGLMIYSGLAALLLTLI